MPRKPHLSSSNIIKRFQIFPKQHKHGINYSVYSNWGIERYLFAPSNLKWLTLLSNTLTNLNMKRNQLYYLLFILFTQFSIIGLSQENDTIKSSWQNESFGGYSENNEFTERRTLNEKHFKLPNGKVDMFVSSEPINYMENGLWQTIYTSLSVDATSPYKYSNTSNLFKSYYPEKIQQGFKTILEGKNILEMQNSSMYYESNGERLGEVSISNSIAKVDKNIISYPNVYGAGINLLITQKGGKRKLDYIIQNKAALNAQFMNAEYLVFSEDIILPNGWSAKLENGAVLLMDQSGKVVSLYETPSVFDNNKSVPDKPHNENAKLDLTNFAVERIKKDQADIQIDDNIVYEISMNGSTLNILTKVKMTYLKDENRVFPVMVDPTLTASIATITSGWYYDYQPLYGPAIINTTGAPAGSAITNVNLALNVTASQYWWGLGWSGYSGNCANFHIFSLDDGDYVPLVYTCGGNMNNWNCLDPNRSWRTEIWSWDGFDYRARWGFTVTVTYETITAPTSITGTTSICPWGSTLLTASGGTANAGSTPITTQWFTGSCGGTLVGTGASITVSPAATTTYYARRVGQCTTTGCASITVTVNSNVNNPGVITAPASICVGTAANISNVTIATTGIPASAGPNYYYYYQRTSAPVTGWVMYNGPTASLTSALPAAVTGTAGTYLLARNSEFGCAGQVSAPFLNLTVDAAPTLGTLSNPGPIDFCDAGGNFTTAVNVSGQVGSVMWDWGSNNGVWNNNWVAGANSGICCFPKKISNSDGNADRIRYRVTNGSCSAVTSGTILIRNRYNEAPTSLVSSSSVYCSNAAPGTITLTANFPSNINMNGTVGFYSGSCGGTLVGSVSPSASSSSAAITIPATSTSTTYYARYQPGAGAGCSNSACVSTTVTVNTISVAPTGATGTTTICAGSSTTLTVSGGTAGTGATAEWFTASCGGTSAGTGNSISVSPGATTTYYVRYAGTCNTSTCASVTVTVNSLSTAPVITPFGGTICPNSNYTLTAAGGTAGSGSTINWYSGPGGTGSLLGTGGSLTVAPTANTTYYARREGSCNTTSDDNVTVNVKSFVYALNGTNSNTYCTDNAGWQHFYNGDEIIFSVLGNLSGAPIGYPLATISTNSAYYEQTQGPGSAAGCASNQNPGEERFEMKRNWNLDFGGGTPIGSYDVRFYYQTAEKTEIETAAANWMATYPSCGYIYKYATPNGFYWFKNSGSNYTAPLYDGDHYSASSGTTSNGVNYSQWTGIPNFSGGSGAVILIPVVGLPIELMSFQANCEKNNVVEVTWNTASEHNSNYFVVERSRDGISWLTIGTVAAATNSTSLINYSLTDDQGLEGVSYYRLTQYDLDGASETFNVVSLNCSTSTGENAMKVYPNPNDGNFNVDLFTSDAAGESILKITNSKGQIIYTKNIDVMAGNNMYLIKELNLAPGIYFLSIDNGSFFSRIIKLEVY